MTFETYDAGGINAIKPKKRGRKVGEKRTLAFMNRLSDDPDHVKAYFDHPSLVKYKLG